jgi:hypothetical protein
MEVGRVRRRQASDEGLVVRAAHEDRAVFGPDGVELGHTGLPAQHGSDGDDEREERHEHAQAAVERGPGAACPRVPTDRLGQAWVTRRRRPHAPASPPHPR